LETGEGKIIIEVLENYWEVEQPGRRRATREAKGCLGTRVFGDCKSK